MKKVSEPSMQGIERSAFFLYGCRARRKFIKSLKFPFLKGFKNATKDEHALKEIKGVLALAGINADKHFPRIYLNEDSATTLQRKLPETVVEALGNKKKPVIVISPFTSWKTKDVRVSTYLESIRLLARYYPEACFLFCATSDRKEEIRAEIMKLKHRLEDTADRVFNLAGMTNIQELLNLVSQSDLVIASEGATAHMASALDRPLCVVFGPTKPVRVGPWGQQARVIQSRDAGCLGCYKRQCDQWICMDLPPMQLVEPAVELLKEYYQPCEMQETR